MNVNIGSRTDMNVSMKLVFGDNPLQMTLNKQPLTPYGGKICLFLSLREPEITDLCRVLPDISIFKQSLMTQWKNNCIQTPFQFYESRVWYARNKYSVSLKKIDWELYHRILKLGCEYVDIKLVVTSLKYLLNYLLYQALNDLRKPWTKVLHVLFEIIESFK